MRTLTKTLVISASLILLAGMALAGMALAADIRVLSVEEAQDQSALLAVNSRKKPARRWTSPFHPPPPNGEAQGRRDLRCAHRLRSRNG